MTEADRSQGWLYRVWYGDAPGGWILLPLEALFRCIVAVRCWLFARGILKSESVAAGVIVVGNISVGGAGKTPLVAWLASEALRRGYRPAIISRGYGGQEPATPLLVSSDTDVAISGDEALMLARATPARVYVCARRALAARQAVSDGADLIIADDGLQHYQLARDVEIIVVDAEREHGNGHCLPAGPLREPPGRIRRADLLVYSGDHDASRVGYRLAISHAVNAENGNVQSLDTFSGQDVFAIAGIGHPQRFYDALRAHGIKVQPIPVADHGRVDEASLHPPGDAPVLMTSKDAVKYDVLEARHWVVPSELVLDVNSKVAILGMIDRAEERHLQRSGKPHA